MRHAPPRARVGQDRPSSGAGNIDAPGAIDRYTFGVASAPALVYLHSELPCTNNELRWNLRDPSGALVNDNETHRLCFDIGRLTLATPGMYTVTVSGVQNSDATGTYGFTVLPVAPDQVFGIRIGESVGPGQPGTGAGSIETPGAIDRYTFQANAGQVVQLTAVQPCSNEELRWNVRDPTGAIVNADDINRICSDIGRLVLNTAGTYVITVFPISDNPATGTYGFALNPG